MIRSLYNLATDRYQGPLAAIAKLILYLLSFAYGFMVRVLVFLNQKKQQQLKCKVISVGNITLGGTGKTPLVEFIAQYLKIQGHKVAVLSRGYKKKACNIRRRAYGDSNINTMGDEPYMLKMNLTDTPVLVDKDRIRAADSAVRDYGAGTVILDDGFQQWRIKKNLEIVAIDAANPFGNHNLIPRGILREPLSSLKRADIFVITKTNLNFHTQELHSFLRRINPEALIVKATHKPSGFYKLGKEDELLKTETFSGKTAMLVSGIANPESFKNLITSLGINIGSALEFADHHQFSYKDIEGLRRLAQKSNIDTVLTTQKDSVRLKPYLYSTEKTKPDFFVLRIKLELISDEQKFLHRLQRLYSA